MAIENTNELESLLNLPEGTLTDAQASEEKVKIEIPKLVVMTEDEQNEQRENFKTTFGKAGLEIGIKTAREKYGLDFQGKNIDNLLEAHKTKVVTEALADAKVEPNKKIDELNIDLEKLRGLNEGLQKTIDNSKKANDEAEKRRGIEKTISSQLKGEYVLEKEDLLTLIETKLKPTFDDEGKLFFSKNGEAIKNKTTLSYETTENVLADFLTPYSKKPSGGAGGGDDTGAGGSSNLEKFNKEMTDKGVNAGSIQYNREMQKRIREKTLVL